MVYAEGRCSLLPRTLIPTRASEASSATRRPGGGHYFRFALSSLARPTTSSSLAVGTLANFSVRSRPTLQDTSLQSPTTP